MDALKHQTRAVRIEQSLAHCTTDDYEICIEAAMLAGSDWINYALHNRGLTSPQGDMVHSYMLTINELRRFRVADAAMMDAITEIEDMRPLYVRGNAPDGIAAAARALELLRMIRERALATKAV